MKNKHKIRHLEGLRGITAIVVVIHHLKLACFNSEFEALLNFINNSYFPKLGKSIVVKTLELFTGGQLAIWIFWVLSSYVISIKFFKNGKNFENLIIGYFSKRYFRLLIPVLGSVLFAFCLVKLGLMNNFELGAKLGQQKEDWLMSFYAFPMSFMDALYFTFYSVFFNYDRTHSYNAVLWTIYREFLGSLFTISIFGIVRHNSKRFILYAIILFLTIKMQLIWLSAFLAGHVLCDYDYSSHNFNIIKNIEAKIHKYKLLIFMASILALTLVPKLMTAINLSDEIQNFTFSLFVVYLSIKNEIYRKLFALRIPVWLGKISFSAYLLHLPIICSYTCFILLRNNTAHGKLIAVISTLTILIALSVLFTKYIDAISIKIANKIGVYFVVKTNK